MATAESACLERMCDIIGGSEDALVAMVTDAVRLCGIDRAPHSPETWREAVRGLSDAIFQAVYSHLDDSDAPRHDPVVAYGIVRGRFQGRRGVLPEDWSRLMRLCRQAYLELVRTCGSFREDELAACRRFLDWVFDRLEDGFHRGHRQQVSHEARTAED